LYFSIRAIYGNPINPIENAIYGSSAQNAQRDIQFFFPDRNETSLNFAYLHCIRTPVS
jgi:hypothetical protein